MQELHEQLTELLGRLESSTSFAQLIDAIGDPTDDYESDTTRTCVFSEVGIVLYFNKERKYWSMVEYHIGSGMVKAGTMRAYSGRLPAGIKSDDGRAEVVKKLGGCRLSANRFSDVYVVGPSLRLTGEFDETDRIICWCLDYREQIELALKL